MAEVRWLDGRQTAVGTVFCFARNNFAHAAELGNAAPSEPLLFLKSAHSVRPLDSGGVAYPDETFHHEAELVLVIGRDVALGEAPGWAAVTGVALGLDLTRRGVQSELKAAGLPWTVAKSFQGAAPVGPVVPLAQVADPARLAFTLHVAGELRQRGALAEMSFDVPTLLAWLCRQTPLAAGDLVFTGTPPGVGNLRVGDAFELAFEGTAWTFAGRL